jgi:ribose transport system ATP-binding protein
MSGYLLEMQKISKNFPGVRALKEVDLRVKPGEVHCLMGENGAGKSTLIKILAGAYAKDSGEIFFDGRPVEIKKPHDAQRLGISFIFQELSVVNTLTVEENMTLGYESARFGVVDKKTNLQNAVAILRNLKIQINPRELVKNLSVSQKQMMLIAKALSQNVKLIVMDEPTASLTESESQELFRMMRELKVKNVSFLYVSHRFEDIFAVGERITILRDGENAGILKVKETREGEIIQKMVGRDIKETFPSVTQKIGTEILRVEHLTAEELLKDVSFTLKQGQILGISGLAGAGKTELARALFGVNKKITGRIFYQGKPVTINSPKEAIKLGIALLPEERRTQGIVGLMSVRENISLASGKMITRLGMVSKRKDKQIAEKMIKSLRIKTPGPEQQVQFLSGGNQQKTIVAKWMNTNARIVLLDEPTRGIDIGAKSEIYELMNQLAGQGKAIMMFSSELPELLGMCDEIMVMREGRMMGKLQKNAATQEKIMQLAVGGINSEPEKQ